jgi:hypothetical protein
LNPRHVIPPTNERGTQDASLFVLQGELKNPTGTESSVAGLFDDTEKANRGFRSVIRKAVEFPAILVTARIMTNKILQSQQT